ncbi:hypothetical protein EVG20_g5501 [Dentipellis fragilis]|uniref:Uncharacterized protein n=1 Tax=Dentipellis fragilis TaxID=205917 RepID=A0A4Y9YT82_9AGAM|nr:hypothetical protein EVG20_g5501 [Dentipellis fragilis]
MPFRISLHSGGMSMASLQFMQVPEVALNNHGETPMQGDAPALQGLDMLDVSCSARMLRIDASAANIAITSLHANRIQPITKHRIHRCIHIPKHMRDVLAVLRLLTGLLDNGGRLERDDEVPARCEQHPCSLLQVSLKITSYMRGMGRLVMPAMAAGREG